MFRCIAYDRSQYFANGEKIEGVWENNLITGLAVFTDASGKRFLERWNCGNREGDRVPINRTGHYLLSLSLIVAFLIVSA
jgi:hypothetical protein